MKGELLPDADHVVRLCGGSHVREDGSIAPPAFRQRAGEAYLSVNWLEFLGLANQGEQLEEVRRVLATKRTVGSKARLALLSVGGIHALGSNAFDQFVVRHEPELAPPDPSHCGIHGSQPDDLIGQDLLSNIVLKVFPAKPAP